MHASSRRKSGKATRLAIVENVETSTQGETILRPMTDSPTNQALATRLARVARTRTTTVTHYGRATGKPYQVKIWFTVDGDHINLQTMDMRRQWIRNVLANPKISLRIGDEVLEGEATKVSDPNQMKRVVELMKRKYPISLPYLWIKKQPDGAFKVSIRQ
jgi:deazaflavin-dependent oxidoreductase (nitroreductase family)